MKRIGIDARFFGVQGQGLGRYATELVNRIVRSDSGSTYILFVSKGAIVPSLPSQVTIIRTAVRWYSIAEQLWFPVLLYRQRLDLVHFLHFNVPVLYRRRFIVTVHDVLLRRHPDSNSSTRFRFFFWVKYTAYRFALKSALQRAVRIIAVSNFTKTEIGALYPAAERVTTVVYEGVTESIAVAAQKAPAATPEQLRRPYLLYVGNAYPHKNVNFLVVNFVRWSAEYPDFHLTIVGKDDFFYRKLRTLLTTISGSDRITIRNNTSDDELGHLYASAHTYVFPSLYEGFGLPGLEAMSAGVPVLSSTAGALAEVYGDAALYFRPDDPSNFRDTLSRICFDDPLRVRLREAGYRTVQKYSWDEAARKTIELYRNA